MNASAPDRLGALVDRVEDLQLFPAQAARVRAVADDRRSTLDDLAAVVASDPALTASILRLANSAFFGLRRQVGDLRQGIFVLGFRATRDLALALALAGLGRCEHPMRAHLWQQALRGAAAARAIAGCTYGQVDVGDAFVAGLLRDIGAVLLLEVDGHGYAALSDGCGDLLEAERHRYGADHATVGAACLERWGLPVETCEAVSAHHRAWPSSTLGSVVGLADRVERGDFDGIEEAAARHLDITVGWLRQAQRALLAAGQLGAIMVGPERRPSAGRGASQRA